MQKVIGLGNALVDILAKIDSDKTLETLNLPKGSMQLVDKATSQRVYNAINSPSTKQISGGSAANTIHGLARLGVQTAFIGKVGNDSLGNFFKDDMEKSGIHTLLERSNTETGCAMALISPDSERTFATFLGAAVELTPESITSSTFEGYNILHIEGYLVQNHALVQKAVKTAKQMGLRVSLDLASYNVVEANLEFLQKTTNEYVDILFANEEEGKAFTSLEGYDALNAMAKMADIAVYKQGKNGSLIKQNGNLYEVNAINAKSIDTTGAGDLYAAGFLFGLLNNYTLDKCAKIGSITAGNVVQVIGPKMDDQLWEKIKADIAIL